MSHRLASLVLFATAIVLPSQSQILNQNLVQNPGAESGPAAHNFTDAQVSAVPSWTITGGFSVAAYGGGDFLSAGDKYISRSSRIEVFLRRTGKPALDRDADYRSERN